MLIYTFLCFFIFILPIPTASWEIPFFSSKSQPSATLPRIDDNHPQLTDLKFLDTLFTSTPDEQRLLQHGKTTLSHYLHRKSSSPQQSCFYEAAKSLEQTHCGNIEQNDDTKILYAIRLTKCETERGLRMPSECLDLDIHPGFESSNGELAHVSSPVLVSKCVEALARVPQLWTSYSGYYRDITLMCYAVRHDLDRDRLEDLFRNMTLTQLFHTRLLHKQNQQFLKWRHDEFEKLHDLEVKQAAIIEKSGVIEATAKSIHDTTTGMVITLQDSKRLVNALAEKQEMVQGVLNQVADTTTSVKSDISDMSVMAKQGFDMVHGKIADVDERASVILMRQRESQEWLERHQHLLQSHLGNHSTQLNSLTTQGAQILTIQRDFSNLIRNAQTDLEQLQFALKENHEKVIGYVAPILHGVQGVVTEVRGLSDGITGGIVGAAMCGIGAIVFLVMGVRNWIIWGLWVAHIAIFVNVYPTVGATVAMSGVAISFLVSSIITYVYSFFRSRAMKRDLLRYEKVRERQLDCLIETLQKIDGSTKSNDELNNVLAYGSLRQCSYPISSSLHTLEKRRIRCR